MLRILSIVPFPLLPVTSGGQRKTTLLLEELAKNCPVTVVSPVSKTKSPSFHFELKEGMAFSKWRYLDVGIIPKLLPLARKSDLILLDQPFFGWLAVLLRMVTRKKLILHTHNIESERFKTIGKWWWKWLFHYEKWVMRQADGILFISDDDLNLAVEKFKVSRRRSMVATYGTSQNEQPRDNQRFKEALAWEAGVSKETKILLFYGVLSYDPNHAALVHLVEEVMPALPNNCFLVVCGKGMREELQGLEGYEKVKYLGFVPEIEPYIRGCDLVLNPVLMGGGIKTKVIEALALDKPVVSTETGSTGIIRSVCGDMLQIVPDHDWIGFTREVGYMLEQDIHISDDFYRMYDQKRIAERVRSWLQQLLKVNTSL